MAANDAERKRWNDPGWTALWPEREPLTDTATAPLLERASLQSGERVLEIGSGGGNTSLAVAQLVGRHGSVFGVDISAPLVALSEQRAADLQVSNVSFACADMQTDVVTGPAFDVALSQFGVMFFDEPVVAFTNIAAHLRVGARLAFACWQPLDHNPWHIGPTLAPFVNPPVPPAEGKSPTGPFVFGDPARPFAILAESGFTAFERATFDVVLRAGAAVVVDVEQLAVMGVADDALDQAGQAVARHLAQFAVGDDLYDFPLAFQVISAARG